MNDQITNLFSPQNLDETVAILLVAQGKEDAIDAPERALNTAAPENQSAEPVIT